MPASHPGSLPGHLQLLQFPLDQIHLRSGFAGTLHLHLVRSNKIGRPKVVPGASAHCPRFSPSFTMNRGFVAAVVKRRMVAARWFRQFTLAATSVQRPHALPDFWDWKLSMNLKAGRVTPCAPLMADGG